MTIRFAPAARLALWCGSIAALLIASPAIARAAAPPPTPDKPCTLLTDAEIAAAVGGGAPRKSHEGHKAITQGAAKGETMRTCSWSVGNGAVNLSLVKVAPDG